MSSNEGSRKAIIAAFFANLGIAISKLVAFLFTGAASMLAEAIHSFADTGNQGLLMLGGKKAKREPDEHHPFGHSRERYFWAFVVALVIFSIGGAFAIYEGVHKLTEAKHELEYFWVGVAVLSVAIVLESFSLRTAVVETRHIKPAGQSYWQFIRHTKSAELPVVLLEDLGALLGLVFALIGITVAHTTGDSRYDAVGSIAIGVLLVIIAIILVIQMKSLLIGESADAVTRAALDKAILATPEIRSIIHMRTLQMGPDDILVAAKVEMASSIGYAEMAKVIDAAEERMRAAVPDARVIYLEPDVRYADEPAGGTAL
ncbi:MAG: cation transporter [Frankiales bacterium]|nr:cation transporter [Frankiales bacterium]